MKVLNPKEYAQRCNFHAHRDSKYAQATKKQKQFSFGYMMFRTLFDAEDISNKDKNDYLSEQFEIIKDKNHPDYERAKGFLASMSDLRKFWPKEATVWGNIKTKK